MMSLKADLYLDQIDVLRYFSQSDCECCGFASCEAWLRSLRKGLMKPADCTLLSENRRHALEVVLSLEHILPEVEITQHPVPGVEGHHKINSPPPDAPILVSGNALVTQEVMLAVLSTTSMSFHLLFVNCLGHTIDMAMLYKTFTPRSLHSALQETDLKMSVSHRELILPGVASKLGKSLACFPGWTIEFGPFCAGEIPLFFGEDWQPSSSVS